MPFDPRELVDPVFFSRLEAIELRARSVVAGSMPGRHRSPYLGSSVAFATHREYSPGDDLRHLNWKLYARHDRLYIKEYDAETNLNLHLLIDTSASMGCALGGRSKLHYAAGLAAALAHLAIRQRDAVGLTLFADRLVAHSPPRTRASQLDEILALLGAVEVSPAPDTAPALHQAAGLTGRRGLVVLISDLFGDLDPIVGALDHLRDLHHEVLICQILDPVERDLTLDGNIRFRDLESGETLTTPAEGVRAAYRQAVAAWLGRIEEECRQRAIDRVELITTDPLDQTLVDYLVKRAKTA